MIRRPPRSTQSRSSAASDVYKRQAIPRSSRQGRARSSAPLERRYPGAVTLRLFDTASRTMRELVPLRAGHVGLYLCGAPVQGAPHIGHLKTAVAFDVLVRWLRRSGLEVTFIRNVTDVEDKILALSLIHISEPTRLGMISYADFCL